MRRLELPDVRADVLEVRLLVGAGHYVVRAGLLVRGDEVGVVDGGERGAERGHVRHHLALQVPVEDLRTLHGVVHARAGDVPPAEDKVVRVDHGQDIGDGDVDILAGRGVSAEADGGRAEEGADVVGLLDAGLGVPDDVVAVGEDRRGQRRTVVAAPTDHHKAASVEYMSDGAMDSETEGA